MAKVRIIDAAKVMQAVYDETNDDDVKMRIDIRGVQAVYLKDGTLVIPGTNELSDWFEFNFDVISPTMGHGFEIVPGDSGAQWHAGFLEHAQTVYAFAKPLRPKLIIGHSLGAASAQIVGMSLKTPTIAFASPRTNRGNVRLGGEGWVVNLCRADDTVCHVPPNFLGFRHIGSVYWMMPEEIHEGEDHRIDKYLALIDKAPHKDRLPATWPI
jgi:hypothetical protein